MTQYGFQEFNFGAGGSSTNLENLSAPVALVQALQHQVNEQDVQALIQAQKHILMRFEKTNEMLITCNALLSARFSNTSKELKRDIQLLMEMKKDLESVFRRIRFLKMKLSQQYPAAFSASQNARAFDEEEEEERDISISGKGKTSKLVETAASSSCSQDSSPSAVTSPSTSDS